MSNVGKIKQIIGSVLDITFENGHLPEIFNALEIDLDKKWGKKKKVVAEVQQHLGDNTVRAIALSSTDGMVRGLAVKRYRSVH